MYIQLYCIHKLYTYTLSIKIYILTPNHSRRKSEIYTKYIDQRFADHSFVSRISFYSFFFFLKRKLIAVHWQQIWIDMARKRWMKRKNILMKCRRVTSFQLSRLCFRYRIIDHDNLPFETVSFSDRYVSFRSYGCI